MLSTFSICHQRPSRSKAQAGYTLMQCALANSTQALFACSPDVRPYRESIANHIALAVAHYGPDMLSPDLRELEPLKHRLRVASRFNREHYNNGKDLPLQSVRFYEDLLQKYYESAAVAWDLIWKARSQPDSSDWSKEWEQPAPSHMEEDKANEWVLKLANASPIERSKIVMAPAKTDPETDRSIEVSLLSLDGSTVYLRCCNMCRSVKPRTELKRCARCGKTRYVESF